RNEASEEAEESAFGQHPYARTVGALLRETRLHHGGDLHQIATILRIRAPYLEALEESRSDRLPGPAYAIGFVRAYADYLGLDGAAVVRRFKSEAAGLDAKPDLAFPMPLPDRGKPGMAILIVALIVGACAYGTWYYVTSGDRVRPERVAAVPSQLLPLPPPAPASEPVPVPPAGEPASASAAAPPSETNGQTATQQTAAALPSSPVPAPVPAVNASPAAPAASAPASSLSASPTPVPAAPAMTTAAIEPPPTAATEPQAAAAPPASAAEGSRVFGATDGPVRIVIKANADSWIQVKDGADQSVVAVRTLKQGDTYRVPDRQNLVLRTGNAGGLDLTVDGRPIKPIGAPGKARTVSLDAGKLLGTATTAAAPPAAAAQRPPQPASSAPQPPGDE
ncbi:MAG TPA: helix-turn-helix domain-containing protein, partial [Stellaceae bacterium]